MARLLMRALDRAGYSPQLASELRSLDKTGDPQHQDLIRQQSLEEASRLVARYQALPEESRPCLWFTYHVYYKAPDWIGPRVAQALEHSICRCGRFPGRKACPWALGHGARGSRGSARSGRCDLRHDGA